MKAKFYTRFGKIWCDALVALVGLLLLSPLLLVIAVAVRLSSPGPALFSQIRTGQFGKPFRILKFRTMRVAPEGSGSLLTASGDPRITPLGHWLRKTKMDELPQLFNVLAGHMSLVGPRPEVPLYTARYSDRQKRVLRVRPGVTSPQIEFDEEAMMAAHPDKEGFYLNDILPAKLEVGLAYCDRIRFLEDQRIILRTASQVLRTILGGLRPTSSRLGDPASFAGQKPSVSTPAIISRTSESCSAADSPPR